MSVACRARGQLAAAVAAAVALLAPALADAATIKVTATADEFNASPGGCSLREAVWSADNDSVQSAPGCAAGSGEDRIAVPGGIYELAVGGSGEQGSAAGDLDLTAPVTIERVGGGRVIVDGKGIDRVFEINTAAGNGVTISGITVQGGHAAGPADTTPRGAGGGILVLRGGLTLTDSTVYGNLADSWGGGIEVRSTGSINVVNTTISGNRAGHDGGGLDNSGGVTTMLDVTVTANVADSEQNYPGGGGIGNFGGTTTLRSTIVAGNTERRAQTPDCFNFSGGTLASLGQTLIGSTKGCDFTSAAGDLSGADPKLGPLADNGGPTPTHALLAGSAALNTGSGCAKTDQRGVPRTAGGACDIGAYELVRCEGRVADRIGTNKDDRLTGTPGADAFLLLGGRDKAFGLAGNDVFCGGAGSDREVGGAGRDRLAGDTGKDRLRGGTGNDVLVGGGGKDKLGGGPGRDRLRGDGSDDTCNGGSGDADSARGCESKAGLP
jgi:CSLREA domain-containing protein